MSRCFQNINNKRYSYQSYYIYNNTDLDSGLYTTVNLTGICTVELKNPPTCPTKVDLNANLPFYFNYNVDPNGYIFSGCNKNSYLPYRCCLRILN